MKNNEREKKITKVSIVGIATNFLLVILKAIIGLLSNSIAIVLDALNNLSDAVSSVVTIIGLVLAGKKPDRKHPYGYGRIEYFSSLIVSFIVIVAGISAFRESFSKIITPEETNFSVLTFIIMLIAVITKILLGLYTKNKGKELNSGSLIASGSDALFDSIITLSTIIGAIINVIFKFNIDGYLGIIISLIIIKSGIEMIKSSASLMIGERISKEFANNIRHEILSYKDVLGVYDLFLDNFGPENYLGYVHIEVSEDKTTKEISKLTRLIEKTIREKYGIFLTIGVYIVNIHDKRINKITSDIKNVTKNYKEILQVHGIYIDIEEKEISFDMVIDFIVDDKKSFLDKITKEIKMLYPDYQLYITLDTDISLS